MSRGEWAVLAAIAALGALNLPMPFGGDQALFLTYARGMDAGLVLYRDLWDSKPPGLYLLYQAAGRLFGFHQVGAHLLELGLLVALSTVMLRTSRRFIERDAARLALPLLTVGIYYLSAEPKQMVQAEILAALPLYLTLVLSERSGRGCAFAAGVAGGAALWLKLYFLPVLAAIWGVRLWRDRKETVWIAAGCAISIALMALWVAKHGVLREFWWTAFVYPRTAIASLDYEVERMRETSLWFVSTWAAAIVPAAWAVAKRPRAKILIPATLWLVVALLLAATEKSWWRYYLLLAVVPLGLLAALGLDDLLARTQRLGKLALGALRLVLLAAPLADFATKLDLLRRNDWALNEAGRTAFRVALHPPYAHALDEAAYIEREIAPHETLHVFGDPLILMLSGRTSAVPTNGWSPQTWSPELWQRVLDELKLARPDWVHVNLFTSLLSQRRYPELIAWVRAEYDVAQADRLRAWFRRSDLQKNRD